MNLEMIEVYPNVDIQVIQETLTRIGIPNKKEKLLYPSCYLYEENEKFYIVHFKELFLITRENSYNAVCEEDIQRKNAIIFCLKNWDMIDVEMELIEPHDKFVFVLGHTEKSEWQIKHKFNIFNLQEKTNEK